MRIERHVSEMGSGQKVFCRSNDSKADLGWLAPLDEEAIRSAAIRANGKVAVAHEANVTGGFGAEIVARLHELCENGAPLKIKRVGTPNVHIPATPACGKSFCPTLSASPTPCGPW